MNIEEAKEVIENYFTHYIDENPELALAVSIVLSELEKKDKVINEMAKSYVCKRKCNLETKREKYASCTECVIDFFVEKANKVEREGK